MLSASLRTLSHVARTCFLAFALPARCGAFSLDEPQGPPSLDLRFDALPFPLLLKIFALLPVDTRLRCSEVNRAWRAMLADTTFWESIDVSIHSGLTRFSWLLFRAAVKKAGGQLRALYITGRRLETYSLCFRLLLEVAVANKATLMDLRAVTEQPWQADDVRELVEAASNLRLEVSVIIFEERDSTAAMLRNEPPFQALHLRRLNMFGNLGTEAVVTFSSHLRCHASLEEISFREAALHTADAMGAVVDACIALRLQRLEAHACYIVPAVLPELTRLVAAGALRELIVQNQRVEMFDEAQNEETLLFVAAVRASAMTRLRPLGSEALPESVVEVAAFIDARAH